MKTVGLDIGSYAMKAVVGQPTKDGLDVIKMVEAPNPIGAFAPDSPQKREQLITAIKQLFETNDLPFNEVRVSISESQVSTKAVTMPLLSDAELSSAIQWQVEQHIPIPLEEMQYEYVVLRRSDKQSAVQDMDVLLVGTRRQVVQNLADILLECNLDVTAMETDTLAQLRVAQLMMPANENVALVNIGASFTTVTVVAQGVIQFVHSAPTAGLLFTRAVERGLGLDAVRAEEYKRAYGLLAGQLEGKMRTTLAPVMDSLVAEIQKAIRFFLSEHSGQSLQKMYVTGGSLYLPDLLPYLSQALSLELFPVELGSIATMKFKESVPQDGRFVVSAGLAMKPRT